MKDRYVLYFLLITLALVILTIFYPYAVYLYFEDIDMSGSFGSSYGALNALFSGMAYAGIIITIAIQKRGLENQRSELKLQREEAVETRKEFSLSRTTNVIYSQLERFESTIKELKIVYNNQVYVGNDAVFILEKQKEFMIYDEELSEEENLKLRKTNNHKQTKILIENRNEIEKFAVNISNSVNVLKSLLFKSSLGTQDLNDLKNLYFDNIGYINMVVIESISELAQEQIEIFDTDDYIKFNMDVGQLLRADIFLKPVVEFYHTKLDETNYERERTKWLKQKGSRH